jgi:hypothetical protein
MKKKSLVGWIIHDEDNIFGSLWKRFYFPPNNVTNGKRQLRLPGIYRLEDKRSKMSKVRITIELLNHSEKE